MMHEIILNEKTTALERMVAVAVNSTTGITMHLFPNLFVRPSTLFVKSKNWKNLTVVEIGTDKGYNAKTILDNIDVKVMYLIDPYLEKGLQGSSVAEKMAKERLKPYENKIRFIKKKSEDAVDLIPNEIDFLYIDGDHSKKQVARELKLFYPKMKKGGIIAGHDYCGMHMDLTEAVVEFKQKQELELFGGSIDFWMIKK